MNDNTQQILNNANTTISSQFSQSASVWSALDSAAVQRAGRDLAKEIQKGLKEGLSDLKILNEPLNDIKNAFNKAIQDITDPSKLQGVAGTTYKKFIKDLETELDKLSKVQDAITRESNKAVPDMQTLLALEQQRNELLKEAKRLNDLNQLTVELIAHTERERLLTQKQLTEMSEEERAKVEAELKAVQQRIASIKDDINAITGNLNEGTQELNETLEKWKKRFEEDTKTFKERMSTFQDSLSSMQSVISSGIGLYNDLLSYNNIDTQIKNWSMNLDDYTKLSITMGNTFGSGYSGTGTFNTLKNDIISGMTEGMEGFYNDTQILNMMEELTTYSFSNNELAVRMAGDLAFAKEYMGLSSDSLQSMYALQVRTGQDDSVKKSLNVIAALQRTGNSIGEQQLDAYNKSATTLQDKLLDMGLSAGAASEAYEQIMMMADAADKAYGPGMGQQMIDTITGSLDWDHLGTMTGSNWQNALQALYSGNMSQYWNYIQEGPSATAAYNAMSNAQAAGDYATMFGLGQDSTIFQGTNDALARQFRDPTNRAAYEEYLAENNTVVENNTDALDDMQYAVGEALPEALKEANAKMTEFLELPWNDIAHSIADENFAKSATTRFMQGVNMIVSSISLLVTALNMRSFSDAFGSVSGGSSGGGIKSILQAFSKSKGGGLGTGLKALGKGAWTAAKPLISAAGITAGVMSLGSMVSDGVSVGSNGFTDQYGNQVEGTGGFGDGLAAAFTNSNIDATGWEDAGSGTAKGAGVGAMIGTFIGGPGIGTLVGAGIGGVIGAVGSIFAHNRKEEAKEQAQLLEEQKKQTELAEITANNTEAIKNARDVALSDRYDDNRFGVGSPPIAYSAPAYGAGGEYNGIDIDGWVTTSDYASKEDFRDNAHSGIDFAGKAYGTAIGSASPGKVTTVVTGHTWDDGTGKANYVDVYNGTNGITYRYYHLASAAVSEGQEVQAGTVIGYVGNTGFVVPAPTSQNPTAGTHLHFSALRNGSYIDPRPYVTSAIFYPGSNISTSSDNTLTTLKGNNAMDATPYYASFIPNFQAPMGSDNSSSVQVVDSPSIIRGLEQINKTLLAMDKRQDNQQRILDALTRTPIQSLGV